MVLNRYYICNRFLFFGTSQYYTIGNHQTEVYLSAHNLQHNTSTDKTARDKLNTNLVHIYRSFIFKQINLKTIYTNIIFSIDICSK